MHKNLREKQQLCNKAIVIYFKQEIGFKYCDEVCYYVELHQ